MTRYTGNTVNYSGGSYYNIVDVTFSWPMIDTWSTYALVTTSVFINGAYSGTITINGSDPSESWTEWGLPVVAPGTFQAHSHSFIATFSPDNLSMHVTSWAWNMPGDGGDISSIDVEVPMPAMTTYVNVNGVWKNSMPYVNVAGVWKNAIAYKNVSGIWIQ
jgi:hypothetical protein